MSTTTDTPPDADTVAPASLARFVALHVCVWDVEEAPTARE
jgi:hypothetical protein